jgi:hypothetical protein
MTAPLQEGHSSFKTTTRRSVEWMAKTTVGLRPQGYTLIQRTVWLTRYALQLRVCVSIHP